MRYLFILLLLSGCSARWHLQQAKRHELIAQSKGANIDTEIRHDTIFVEVSLLGTDSTIDVSPEIDTTDFFEAIEKNDSAVLAIDAINKAILRGEVINKEKALAELKKIRQENLKLKWRIAQGFSRDSTYRLQDGLCTITAEIKDGLLKNLHHERNDTVLRAEEVVPVEIKKILKAGYSWRDMLIGGIVIGVLLLVLGFILGRSSKKE